MSQTDRADQNKRPRSMALFAAIVLAISALQCTLLYVGYINKVFKFGP